MITPQSQDTTPFTDKSVQEVISHVNELDDDIFINNICAYF